MPDNCIISFATGAINFKIRDTKPHVPVINLLTQDNARLLEQLNSGFKRRTGWNKYQSKVQAQTHIYIM